jgi:hypothetical protein
MRAFRAVSDAAGLDDVGEQAEIGEVEPHGWYTNPSPDAKADFAKRSWI